MSRNHDYQNEMSTDTRSVDTAGELAADALTVENAGVHEETVVSKSGPATYSKPVGTFGMIPGVSIDTDYSLDRMAYFQKLAIETGGRRNPLNPMQGGEATAAYKSQKDMSTLYQQDYGQLLGAQRDFDLLVPIANMAAKSFAKSQEVGELTGLSDLKGPKLNVKEERAMSKASSQLHSPLDEETSLAAASTEMMVARKEMVSASEHLASEVKTHTVDALQTELEQTKSDKAAVEAKIQRAQHMVGYFTTVGGAIAGGSSFLHNHVSVGRPHPLAGKGPDEIDLRHSGVGKIAASSPDIKMTGNLASDAVAFGMKLYHEEEVRRLAVHIDVVEGLVATSNAEARRHAIAAAYMRMSAAADKYAMTVAKYEARMNDRRKHTASIGRQADKLVDNSGQNSKASDAMLWTTTISESQSLLSTAIESGVAAQATIDQAHKSVRGTRHHPWGTLEDAYSSNNTPRVEGESGMDMVALTRMRDLMRWWMEGARDVQQTLLRVVDEQAKPVLGTVGYTDEY